MRETNKGGNGMLTAAERRAGMAMLFLAPRYCRRLGRRSRLPGTFLILVGLILLTL